MSGWRWSDLPKTLLVAITFGALYVAWGLVWDAFAFANTLAPGLRDLFYGFWLSAGLVGAALVRRPGAAIATQTLAVLIEMALRQQLGLAPLVGGLVQGGLSELVFALTRYRRFDVRLMLLAGAAAGLGSLVVDSAYRPPTFAGEMLAVKFAARVTGGALLAGWLGTVLVRLPNRLVKRFPQDNRRQPG